MFPSGPGAIAVGSLLEEGVGYCRIDPVGAALAALAVSSTPAMASGVAQRAARVVSLAATYLIKPLLSRGYSTPRAPD
jgi:hypothetical protein